MRVKFYTDQHTSDKFRIHKEPFWVFLRQSDPLKQDIFMFRPLESKFVNFTRFPAIFDVYKPYDAIYKRAFAGVFFVRREQEFILQTGSTPHLHHYTQGRMVDEGCVRKMRENYTRYRMLMQSRNRSTINKFHYNGISNDFH